MSHSGTYQYRCEVRLDDLHLAITAYEGVPYLVVRRRVILLDSDEQRAVPTCHAIRLFVSEDQILKVFVIISLISVLVLVVVLAAPVG